MGICESKPKECETCYELFITDNDDRLSELPMIKTHNRRRHPNLKRLKQMTINQIYKNECEKVRS